LQHAHGTLQLHDVAARLAKLHRNNTARHHPKFNLLDCQSAIPVVMLDPQLCDIVGPQSTFLAAGPQAPVEIVDTTHIPPDHWRAQLPHEVGDA
jgi:hypothetical protein